MRTLLGRRDPKTRIMIDSSHSLARTLVPNFPSPSSSARRFGLFSFAIGALALTAAGSSRADIYRTVGPDGVISFTNSAKKGGKLYARTETPAVRMPSD